MKIIKTVDLSGIGSNFIPHVGLHPATYVNKILLGGRPTSAARNGTKQTTSMILLNVRSGKMLHSFQCLSNSDGIITTLEQSPAVDTVAVGTSTGSAHLINTSMTKTNLKKSRPDNAVSSISFRTDGNATRQGVAPLAVGCDDGSVSVWDLTPVEDDNDGTTRRTLLTQMEATHHGGVSKLQYLPGEPLLLSTGMASNSVLLHVFDAPDHSGRILRQRKGHTSPPRLLRYLHPGVGGGGILANASDGTDAASCQILSCGGPGDLSLRLFSTARTNLDKEYSQGPGLERKAKKLGLVGPEGRAELLLPEVAGLATSEARSRDWGDLVTIHKDHAMAYVWSTKRGSQTGPVLRQPQWNVSAMKKRPPRTAHATSVAISACGNFALVGTVGGVVYKYNIQSGIPRGSFPRDAASLTEEEERRRKKGIKVAGDVGRTMRMLEKNSMKGGVMPSDVDQAERDRISFMEAEEKRKAIIQRASHEDVVTVGQIPSWCFGILYTHANKKSPIMLPSPATKLTHVRDSDLAAIAMRDFGVAVFDCSSLSILFTSSLDGTIRVWDVPTGLCVDWMSFASPPTSMALSPTGEFLATSHVGRLGISLWCDKTFFRMVLLDGTPIAECEQEEAEQSLSISMPRSVAAKDDSSINGDNDEDGTNDGVPPQAKEEGLITLSGSIFLQWRSGIDSSTNDGADNAGNVDTSATNDMSNKDDGWDAVWSDDENGDDADNNAVYQRRKVTRYLSSMGPSSIDVEISSLCYGAHDLDDGLHLLHLASLWLVEACESNQSFEAVNAYLHRFLHVHSNIIIQIDTDVKDDDEKENLTEDEEDPQKLKLKEFAHTIAQLRQKQKAASNRLQGKMQHTICLLRHLSRMV
ncbi:WD40 repeat domain-containing protein [Skeletonema marinoi]|uniref:WD40 repeat domain-containing protein n=2 Tax=Skeletonema marinoi TaxID=267567 RepID=A0AAD8XVX3_9STRA|nr:WD40 repeat domain-containing protein [Skeletonema marinoi]